MKRIFVSFAVEDKTLRDLLKGQSKHEQAPFEYIDMSVKEPWDSMWKTKCRSKIKGCDGVITIITKNTKKAHGQIWEMKCAKEEDIPIVGIYGYADQQNVTIPDECGYIRIMDWKWDNISDWLESL